MKKNLFFLAALLFLPVLSFSQDEQTRKVAILETVDREGTISYGVKLMLRSNLSYAITNTPGYEGYDRVDLESIMGEQSFQRTGMVSDEQIKQLGEMTGASYILVAEVARVDDTHIFITAKILNVETARLEKTANVQTQTDAKDIEAGCRRLAAMLLGTEMSVPDEPADEQPSDAPSNVWSSTLEELMAQQLEARKARQETRQEKAEARARAEAEAEEARRRQNEASESYMMSLDGQRAVPEGIYPGMKYRQYRKLYRAADYVRMPGDRYSPLVGGLCSFLVPGLGQAINGDFGRGLAFFGGTVAGYAAIGAGVVLMDNEDWETGSAISTVGSAIILGTAIWAIIDGVQHAKIKNMYLRDVAGLSSVEVDINPYIASTATPFAPGACPAFGLSLNFTF